MNGGTKRFFASKTVWFNVLAFIVAVVGQFGYTGELPGEWTQFILPAVFLVNVVLRFISDRKVTL